MQTVLGYTQTGLLWYAATTAPVVLGFLFGVGFTRTPTPGGGRQPEWVEAVMRFDAKHYARIVDDGYQYDPAGRSSVAFFPAYPLAAAGVARVTGWETPVALLVVSNAALVAAFGLFAAYLRARDPAAPPRDEAAALALFGLFPVAFFYRTAYAESLFVVGLLVVLVGIRRQWPVVVLAVAAGFVTGVRPVGVAAAAAVLWHILTDAARGDVSRRLLIAAGLLPLTCWGLLAYMAYQDVRFDNPLAFAQTQEHWSTGVPPTAAGMSKYAALAVGEPVWGVYDPASARYWATQDGHDRALFSLTFWNPIVFVGCAVLIGFGAARRWLSGPEVVLGAVLLAIPYLTRAYEMSMGSHARFAAVVVPAYVVAARLVRHAPGWMCVGALAGFAAALTLWSALYTAAHAFY